MSSIDRDLSLFDEERENEGKKEGHRDSNKQIDSIRYIHIISANPAFTDSRNEANRKSFIVPHCDICVNEYQ